jgi:small subunit ribosomal protein S21
MLGVRLKENDSLDVALKKFKSKYEKAGILAELKKREFYLKPSVLRKRKMRKAAKKRRKYLKSQQGK